MPLHLRADIHWCDCGGRAVFLDTIGDRYFCLPQSANDAFLRLAASRPAPGDAARLRSLVENEILVESVAPRLVGQPPAIAAPMHDLGDCRNGGLMLATLALLAAEVRAARALRRRPFHHVLAAARERALQRPSPSPGTARSIERIAAAARALAFITGRHDRCLVRALAAHAMCKRSGSEASLVLGVIAHPFTAHCWVQAGNAVVVGGYEQARLYTPILVI